MATELRVVVSYATLGVLAAGAAFRPREGTRIVRAQIARQIVFSGWDGVPFVAFMGGAMGLVTVAVSATLLPSGQTPALIAKILTFVLVRELAPWVTAIVVILRSCSAITVELGYMSQRGEIEAMQMLGIDPARFVLLPRFVGMIVAQVALTAVFVLAAFAVGLATAAALGVAPAFGSLEDATRHLAPIDVLLAVLKAIACGTIVAAVSCYHGLSVGRDITETPRRTTRALMEALVHCTLASALLTLVTL
jgi:phospholipid/cholesterol/gamma-HCH transport system permease protein